MTTHTNHAEYWREAEPRLRAYMERQRDPSYEAALEEALAFFAFMSEDFPAQVQRHRELLPKLTLLLLVPADVVRAVPAAYLTLSPITLMALARVALESFITLKFIASSSDPAMWADRYARFAQVEMLIRAEVDLPQDADAPLFPPAMLEQIRANSPEWITRRGKLRKFWTADDGLNSVSALSRECGLEEEYVRVYTSMSKYVHASALAVNGYSTPGGLQPIGVPSRCRNVAGLAVKYCFETLSIACGLFGIPLDQLAYNKILIGVLEPSAEA